MSQEYDIYEKVEGSYLWRAVVIGREQALLKLKELSGNSSNEFVIMHTSTREVVFRLKPPKA